MGQDELERRLAQIAPGGDTSKLRYQVQRKTRKVPNPAAVPTLPDGSQNPAYVYGSLPEIEQTYEVRSWTNPTTGATIDAEPQEGGTYTITNDDAGTKQTAANEDTPEKKNAAALQAQREKNAALPADQDPAYETDAERRKRAQDRIDQQGRDAEAERTRKRQEEADARAAAERNKPTTVPTNTTEPYIVQQQPDGSIRSFPNPNYKGPEPKPGSNLTIKGGDGKTYLVPVDAQGRAGEAQPLNIPGDTSNDYAPEYEGAPPVGVTPEEIAAGLVKYSEGLDRQVSLYMSSGGKQGTSPENATKLMKRRHAVAESVASAYTARQSQETTTRGQQITQRGQDVTDANNRRSTANSVVSTVMAQMSPQTKFLAPGKAGVFVAAMDEAIRNGLAYAGLNQAPPAQVSFLDPYRPAPPAAPSPNVTAASTPRPVTQPNAIGLGEIPGMMAPSGAAVEAVNAATQAQSDAAFGGLGITPNAAPPPPSPPPAVNPVTGAPITVPATPSADQNAGMGTGEPPSRGAIPAMPPAAPADVFSPVQGNPTAAATPPMGPLPNRTPIEMPQGIDLSTPLPDPGTGPVGMAPPMPQQQATFLDVNRTGRQFDPHSAAADLSRRLGISPDIMAQVVQSGFGQTWTPPGRPLGVA